MKRVEKQRKPLVFRVGLEGGTPSLQVVREEPVAAPQPHQNVDTSPERGRQEYLGPQPEVPQEEPVLEAATIADAVFVNRDGTVTGPFTEKELRRHWANGVIYADDYVWKEGMAEWVVLGSYFGVPVISSHSTNLRGFSKLQNSGAETEGSGDIFHSKVVLPVIFSILSMLSVLYFIVAIPENKVYIAIASGVTLVLAMTVCFIGRKLSLVLLMTVNVLLPVLAWYYFIQNETSPRPPGETVEQKEEPLPASTTPQVASKKV
jgi:hypothetical protein